MTTVARLYRFRATHSLPDFAPPWCFPHQHDYTVEVVAQGGVDTDVLDRRWADTELHGTDLNEIANPSTVEHLAERFLDEMPAAVFAVTVWEDQARWGRAERP
jgi:6-pyruvoyl-tetrahydropterin synthase